MAADIVKDMAAYYAQRAATYERVYFKPERQADLRAMEAALAAPFAGRHVLEVACGTGWWTPHGARHAAHWLATDLNPETMALARAKPLPACVRFATMDAYSFEGLDSAVAPGAPPFDGAGSRGAPSFDGAGPRGAPSFDGAGSRGAPSFDGAFAGCWWSHVPLQRLPAWLDALHARLAPGARVVFLDNSFVQTSSTPLSRTDEAGNTYQQRPLDDGSVREVLKNFPTLAQARAVLGPRAHQVQWTDYAHYWWLTYELH